MDREGYVLRGETCRRVGCVGAFGGERSGFKAWIKRGRTTDKRCGPSAWIRHLLVRVNELGEHALLAGDEGGNSSVVA